MISIFIILENISDIQTNKILIKLSTNLISKLSNFIEANFIYKKR